MELFGTAAVLELRTFRSAFQKKETVYVPPRRFHSLTLRLSGAISIRTEQDQLLSAAPCITYVPMGMGYHTEVLESGQMLAVHFTMADEAGPASRAFVFTPDPPDPYLRLFSALTEAAAPGQERNYRTLSLFYSILDQLQKDLQPQQTIPKRIRQARAILDKEFADPQLSVSAVADRLGLSTVYLRRAFRAAYGDAPLSYLQALRLSCAKTLLEAGYHTVSEVAQKSGYSSLSHFSATFRKQCGLSPQAYMRSTCITGQK